MGKLIAFLGYWRSVISFWAAFKIKGDYQALRFSTFKKRLLTSDESIRFYLVKKKVCKKDKLRKSLAEKDERFSFSSSFLFLNLWFSEG